MKVIQVERAMLERVEANFRELFQKWITENGRHLRDIILNTKFMNNDNRT